MYLNVVHVREMDKNIVHVSGVCKNKNVFLHLQEYFFGAPVLEIPGKLYEVRIIYCNDDHKRDYPQEAVRLVLKIH